MLPFDLHVLSIPPAFNLSHDQTLQFNYSDCIAVISCCVETALAGHFKHLFFAVNLHQRKRPHKLLDQVFKEAATVLSVARTRIIGTDFAPSTVYYN